MTNINKIKIEIWEAQNTVYRYQTLHGNTLVEEILGVGEVKRIEKLMDRLDMLGEAY